MLIPFKGLRRSSRPMPTIRPLRRGDESTVEQVFEGLTAQQRWQRFHAGMPRLSTTLRRRLADVDAYLHVALVMELAGRPVGIGRYHRLGTDVAEIAVAVAARHVGQGLGRHLVGALLDHARSNGVHEVVFEVLADNEPTLRMARAFGAEVVQVGPVVSGRLLLERSSETTDDDPSAQVSGVAA